MSTNIGNYDEKNFTTLNNDDKINKEEKKAVSPGFGKPVYRGSNAGVKNRFLTVNDNETQKAAEPYNYIVTPLRRYEKTDKIAESFRKSFEAELSKQKKKTDVLASNLTKAMDKLRADEAGIKDTKSSSVTSMSGNNESSLKATTMSFKSSVPKEQPSYSGKPVSPKYGIAKSYGTETEKDTLAILQGLDEVTGKDNTGRYLRDRMKWFTEENRYPAMPEKSGAKMQRNDTYTIETTGYSGKNMLKKYASPYSITMNDNLSARTKEAAVYMKSELEKDGEINQFKYNMWLSKSMGARELQQDVFQYSVMKYLRAVQNLKNSNSKDETKNREVVNFIGAVIRETSHNSPYGGDDMHEKIENALAYTTKENIADNYEKVIKKWFEVFVKSCDEKYLSANESTNKKSISPYLIERGINQIIDDFNNGKTYSELYLKYNASDVSVYNTRDRKFHYEGPTAVGLEPEITVDRK